MGSAEQDLFNLIGQPGSIVEFLDSLSFDELVEIDLFNNRIRNLFHVEGKYFVPVFDGSFKDLYRYSSENMIHPDDQRVHKEFMNHDTMLERLAASKIPGVISEEFRYRLQDGRWCWVRQVILGGPQHGLPDGVIRFYVFDIQNRKDRELGEAVAGLYRASTVRDAMTGLRREKDFLGEARELISSRKCRGWCLIALDIDQFKLFNEWYGREAGDLVLAKIGGYLVRRELEDGWLAGYFGQDDFCVLMPYSEERVQALYKDIDDIVAEFETSMGFTPIFGICMVDETIAALDLLDRARIASNAAKQDFKNRVRFFEPEMRQQTDAEYRVLADFQQAIANHEIFFVVQPQCRLSTGQIVGAEALARWKKASGEVVQPEDFVPILEKHGFITDLDCHIWESVCACIRSGIDNGITPVPVSVNVSRYDIYTIDVAEYFAELIERYNLPPSMVKIEITESAYVDDADKVNETVERLRDMGFLVLIDDFGSGYSSLNMLDSVNVDVIKLDMRFLRMNDEDKKKSIRILESTISMAKALGLAVITEGVETAEQADFLHGIGCRYVQGYYLYRPMTVEDFERLISDEFIVDRTGFQVKPNDEFRLREFFDFNVYSDSMLNSMLGAVGIYSWHDDDVDIVRFNEQFYEEVGVENLEKHLSGNQKYIDERDRARFFNLLRNAMNDELNGATDVIRYRRLNGAAFDMFMRVYYLGEVDGNERFYATVRNMTLITELRDELALLSQVGRLTVAFLRYHNAGWRFNVGIHGLEEELGLSQSDLEDELADRSFFDRLDSETGTYLRTLSNEPDDTLGNFTMPLDIAIGNGAIAKTSLSSYCVQDEQNLFSYVLVLRMR